MGTRADFYVGRGKDAEWLGSIAWDGDPDGIDKAVREATTVDAYRQAVAEFFKHRDDVTLPAQGWPWPWEDSSTTDYAYAFDGGAVHASGFGREWFLATNEPESRGAKSAVFPDMTDRKSVTLGRRSGLIILRG